MKNSTRILAIALATSVGLHLFFAGLWAGGRWRAHSSPMDFTAAQPFHPHAMALGAMFHELPSELREQFKQLVRGDIGAMRHQISTEREARKRVLDALGAAPYDADALEKSLAALRKAEMARRTIAHAAIAEIARKVTGEQRAAMRRGLEHMQSRRGACTHNQSNAPTPAVPAESAAP